MNAQGFDNNGQTQLERFSKIDNATIIDNQAYKSLIQEISLPSVMNCVMHCQLNKECAIIKFLSHNKCFHYNKTSLEYLEVKKDELLYIRNL